MQPETITLPLVTSELISSLWKSAPPTFDISLDFGVIILSLLSQAATICFPLSVKAMMEGGKSRQYVEKRLRPRRLKMLTL